MNPLHAFLFGLACGAAFAVGQLMALRWRDRRQDAANYKAGFMRGLSLGAKNHAHWITTYQGIAANGFVMECDRCGNIQENILNADAEWWTCRACDHRMGAPLYDQGKEVPF